MFGAPTDPAYVSFRDGMFIANDDLIDKFRWRWHPKSSRWYKYPTDRFVLDDIALPDTSPGVGFTPFGSNASDLQRSAADLYWPDTFNRISMQYSMNKARFPHLVWTWRNGGDWRAASSREPSDRPDSTSEGDDWTHGLNPECVARVRDVREWVNRGVITAVDGQKLIREIVDECT